ncbi:hypothetical protein VF21_06957 [Pseudogymnoascus sp. 05NY08]|nr:hypothetical protein VF21_06957 [Pseudogymnoascus sp. 05NY08]
MLTGAEVAAHSSRESCWIVIGLQVYGITAFLSQHPGGANILLRNAGTDATAAYGMYHPPYYVNQLPACNYLGPQDPSTAKDMAPAKPTSTQSVPSDEDNKPPHLSLCVRVSDFEAPAKAILSNKSWVYASATANSGQSMKRNLDDWSLISFRPRVLRDVKTIDMQRSILGHASQYPFFVSSMGTLGSAHSSAELGLVKGIAPKGVHIVISTASSKPAEEIMQTLVDQQKGRSGAAPAQLYFQLYIPTDRNRAKALIQKVKRAGYKGLWITVDAPVLGKRTADRYLQAQEALELGVEEEAKPLVKEAGGENSFAPAFGGRAVPGQLSSSLTWKDLKWIREEWAGPIVLKGIQSAADAKLAAEYGCQGVLLSNHGGRQSHGSPSSLLTLLEIRTYYPEVLSSIEVFVDGGLRDGADVLKALCLGATAVGIGRPILYALAAYGAAGVEKCLDILAEELSIGMRLLGITSLDQATPDLVNASRLMLDIWRPELSRL